MSRPVTVYRIYSARSRKEISVFMFHPGVVLSAIEAIYNIHLLDCNRWSLKTSTLLLPLILNTSQAKPVAKISKFQKPNIYTDHLLNSEMQSL